MFLVYLLVQGMDNNFNFEQYKEQVRDANPLIGIASIYLGSFKGKTPKYCCVFHKEVTPSFVLHPSGDFFKCFGCGKVCDVFELVMHFENMSFKDALKFLAQRANIPYPNISEQESEQYTKQRDIEKIESEIFESTLRIVNEAKITEIPAYIEKRGISTRIGDAYGCVSCNLKTTILHAELKKLGYSEEVIDNSKVIHDSRFFENSLIIPVRMRGKLVTFCSRTLKDRDPKYLYLAGHSKGIFNYDDALTQNEIFITEAPLDALALIEHGFTGAVSVGGCNPSAEQISLLIKLANKRNYICFDNDKDKEETR